MRYNVLCHIKRFPYQLLTFTPHLHIAVVSFLALALPLAFLLLLCHRSSGDSLDAGCDSGNPTIEMVVEIGLNLNKPREFDVSPFHLDVGGVALVLDHRRVSLEAIIVVVVAGSNRLRKHKLEVLVQSRRICADRLDVQCTVIVSCSKDRMIKALALFVDLGLLVEEGVRHARHLHHHAVVVVDNGFVLVEQDVAEVRDRQLDLHALEHPAAVDNVG